ncbi:hypothetical protein E4U14_006885 [Claviceps sp. LM454 group G7]|nr:hypothetical protein E4U14_006885 [Claviceps sp. LM454 group G7]
MDQQNQVNAMLQCIEELERRIVIWKKDMTSQQQTFTETLSQQKHDGALQKSQQPDDIILKFLDVEREDGRKEDEIRHKQSEETLKALKALKALEAELERDTALWQNEKKDEKSIEVQKKVQHADVENLKHNEVSLKKDLIFEIKRKTGELQTKYALLQDRDKELNDKNRQLQEAKMALQKTKNALQNTEKELQKTKDALEVTKITLETSESLIQTRDVELKEKDSQLQESNSLSQKKDIELSEQARLLREKDLLLQFSTIGEYVTKCHFSNIATIEINPDRRTALGVTRLKDRYGPTYVNQWEGFLGEQKEIFEEVCNTIGPDRRVFPRLITVEETASNIRPIASEKELEMFINMYYENPVTHVLEKLSLVDPEGKVCNVEGKVVFRYYYFSKDMDDMIIDIPDTTIAIPDPDTNEEPARVQEVRGENSTKASKPSTKEEGPFRPDGMCVLIKWLVGQKGSILIFPYECKPPHNLTNEDLAAVLQLLGNFWTAKKPEGMSQHTWNSVRYAIMQIYDYMIRSLSEFGILITGTAIVFLRIDWASGAKTLQYHLARPIFDAAQASEADVAPLSAVGQYVSFIVRALRQSRHGDHKARMETRKKLSKVTMGTATNTVTNAATPNPASASASGTAMR